ncbi:hypothetical protein MJO29_006144 [Puccinia striiformis f. sp. tritici]|nr:hypothetical protein MJO29_006144 [Puccinia striiformis f. sp. tritici]
MASSSKTTPRTEDDQVPSFPFAPPLDTRWEQVDEFPQADLSLPVDEEDEYEWTEEVEYLTFDFGASHAPTPIGSYSSFQVLGLNTTEPYLKIGNQIYRGEYESLVGTELYMQPVSKSEKGKETNRERSRTEEGGDEGDEGDEEDEEEGEEEQAGAGDRAGKKKVELSYEPLTHSSSRIRWVPVTLTEREGRLSESDSSSPEGTMITDRKTKKRPGAGAGGRHWASHWTKFTPRANRSKNKVTIQPQSQSEPQPQLESQSQPQPESQSQPQPESQSQPQPESQSQPQPESQSQPQPESQSQPEHSPADQR